MRTTVHRCLPKFKKVATLPTTKKWGVQMRCRRRKVVVEVTCAPPQHPEQPELRHRFLPLVIAKMRTGLVNILRQHGYTVEPKDIEIQLVHRQPHLDVSYQIVVGLPKWQKMTEKRPKIKRYMAQHLRSCPQLQRFTLSLQVSVWPPTV